METDALGAILGAITSVVSGFGDGATSLGPGPLDQRALTVGVPGWVYNAHSREILDIRVVDDFGPALTMEVDVAMAAWLASFTSENIGRPLEVQVCGTGVAAPIIQDTIADGRVMITAPDDTLEDLWAYAEMIAGHAPCPSESAPSAK